MKAALLSLALWIPAAMVRAIPSIAWDPAGGAYTLSWDTVTPSTSTGYVGYRVYMNYGYVAPTTLVDTSYQTTDQINPPTFSTQPAYGPYSFQVISVDSAGGPSYLTLSLTQSFFLNLSREDQSGSEIGQNQQWTAGVKMQADADIYAAVYPPLTTFTPTNSMNTDYSASTAPINVVLDDVPRSGVGGSSYSFPIQWDSRDSSGTIVPNGIYTMMIRASDNNGVRDTAFLTFPVDILRFLSLSSTGITAASTQATVTYDLNAAATVTLLFGAEGTRFVQAAAPGTLTFSAGGTNYAYAYKTGDNLPADSSGAVQGSRLLRVMTFTREAGARTEAWNGTNQSGQPLARGLYTFAVSARDDYGNLAASAAGNDSPIAGTISIGAASPTGGGSGGGSGGGTTTDTTPPVISSVSPANSSVLGAGLSAVSAVLADAGGSGLASGSCAITLRDGSGTPLPGTLVFNSTTSVLTLTLAAPLGPADNGTFTASVLAVDGAGNTSVASSVFTLNTIATDPNLFPAGSTSYIYPNPLRGEGDLTIHFVLNRDADVTLQIFDILGQSKGERISPFPAGIHDTVLHGHLGLAPGVYLLRIEAQDPAGKQEIVKKFVVIR